MQNGSNRVLALEGLRGIAAVAVVLFHVLQNFYPMIINGPGRPQHMFFEDNLYGFPPMAFLSGPFAVAIFFVLSGFVLSVGFFGTKSQTIIKKLAAKRYPRLMLPALVSIMIAWFFIGIHASHVVDANAIMKNTDLTYSWAFSAHFWDALYEGAVGIFSGNAVTYNPVTWTMLYEFVGSLTVFAFCLLFGTSSKRWIMYIILLVVTIQTWYLAFALGMILADLYVNRARVFNNKPLGALMLIVGLFFGGYVTGGNVKGTIYETLAVRGWQLGQSRALFLTLGAFFVVAAILSLPKVNDLLARKKVSTLGRYTFALYLVHLPLLYVVAFGMFAYLVNTWHMGYNHAVVAAVAVYLPITAAATWLFERYIDAPSIKLSGLLARHVLVDDIVGKEQKTAPQPK
jgi:peptidoglycan/LPS O-acetylase OafA/YrhL